MRRFSIALTATCLFAFVLLVPSPATADGCDAGGGIVENGLLVDVTCSSGSPSDAASTPVASDESNQYTAYVWATACQAFDPTAAFSGPVDCQRARSCPDGAERLWILWGRLPSGTWEPLGSQCFGRPPTAADAPQATVTPAMVLTALRRIGLPAVQARTQPQDKTLVNFETIFYAEPQTFSRTITLLGQSVDVEARPTRYVWHHGDGTSAATTTPGAPYPSKDVTHEYTDAHRTVEASVDVVYAARFRVAGGAWQDIAETVTISGPSTSLRISEATPVLSGSYE